ncbi:PREDICTED: venom serine protease-like [Polistes dominula]|uniref:Venom serine protease-like n=1 Tax=Polistes dominula TaxID=743375 RepID=A0ABM1IVK3_POLDO|nr:PREDICTED: venom serine protease-like [Polistes dominula]
MKLGKYVPFICMLLGVVHSEESIEKECDYSQYLQQGVDYYVYNPDFPDYYTGEHNCRWEANSNTRVQLNCSFFDVPPSPNCTMDYLKVKISDDIEYKFCGLNSFSIQSIGTRMEIIFHSRYNTYGGKFQCTLRATEEECKCGWKNPSRIVGGVETGVNEYPMMAGLVDFRKRILLCGATIITPQHVITAAHCVLDFINNYGDFGVIVGEHDVTTGADTNVTKIHLVSEVIIHPNYKRRMNDVAVVKTKTRFDYSMKVGPACLPFYYTRRSFVGEVVTALGWGLLSFSGAKSDVLMKVNLHVISNHKCSNYYSNISDKQICTYDKGKDACQFDSGGPELWHNPSTNRLTLLGVISYGKTCADENPGVAMRITSFMDFILKSTPGETYCKVY